MLGPRTLASLVAVPLAAMLACHDDPQGARHEPMRSPSPAAREFQSRRTGPMPVDDGLAVADGAEAPQLAERPPADPAITKAIDLVGGSGLRFIDQAADEHSKPSEFTAEQFASMLRTKWDWIGYDITEIDPWIEEIGARSFKSNLPYQVVLEDGTRVELRGWLGQQLAASEDP